MKILEEYEKFKILYSEIIEGKSWSENLGSWLKHLTNKDHAKILTERNAYVDSLKKDGIPAEKEKLLDLENIGAWTKEKEEKIEELRLCISDNQKILNKIAVKSQRAVIEGVVKDKAKELSVILEQREKIVHPTLEYYSAKYYSDLLPRHCFYSDESLTKNTYSKTQYDYELSDEEIQKITIEYYVITAKFSENNMRILAAMPIALNDISFCKKNILNFLGKPITQFTSYQSELLSKTIRNINILENTDGEPPEITDSTDVSELVDWYDLNYSVIQGKRSKNNMDGEIKMTKEYVKR